MILNKRLIQVDKNDKALGFVDKLKAHQGEGILHRAFSVVVVNHQGEILIQQRSKHKMLWPLFWSNTCCSHPTKDRNVVRQAEKRLVEEMGFKIDLKPIFKFTYRAKYKNVGVENEVVTVLLGNYQNEKIKPDLKEAADYKWINYKKLLIEMKQKPELFTPWFKQIMQDKNLKFLKGGKNGYM